MELAILMIRKNNNMNKKNISFIDLKTQQNIIKSSIYNKIDTVLEHGLFIMGPEVQEFEKKLCQFTGAKYCVAVANGTDALLISLLALNIQPGDEIITSAFTFAANSEVIHLLKAKPVYVDIDEKTFNINHEKIEQAITSKTKAIMPINLYGQCSELLEICSIAKKYDLPVIEDAAQSFGAMHHNFFSCNIADLSCTSFFPSKPLGCYGDGGAIFTNSDEIAEVIKRIRVHGQKERYYHTEIGMNSRLDTLQAAILLAKLEIFPNEIELRQVKANLYADKLTEHFELPYIKNYNKSVFAQYTIKVKSRNIFIQKLKDMGIPTAIHYPIPAHLQPAFYDSEFPKGSLPITEKICHEVLSLPFSPYLENEDINYITDSLISICVETNE